MKKLILSALLVGVLAGNALAQNADLLKRNTRDAYDAISKHDIARFMNYCADKVVDYGQGPTSVQGKDGVRAFMQALQQAFPDYTLRVEGLAVDGNKVYVQNTFKGTQTGTLGGMIPPTGKTVSWSDVDILEFDKTGKMVAHWANNPNAVLDQLGYHALSNPNTQVVMACYEQFGKHNLPGILALCAPDVVFDITDRVFLPDGMVYTGTAEIPRFFQTLAERVTFSKFEPYRFLADGDDVVVYINGEYKDNKTGKVSRANIVHQVRVVNGKVTWLKGTTDAPKEVTMATK